MDPSGTINPAALNSAGSAYFPFAPAVCAARTVSASGASFCSRSFASPPRPRAQLCSPCLPSHSAPRSVSLMLVPSRSVVWLHLQHRPSAKSSRHQAKPLAGACGRRLCD